MKKKKETEIIKDFGEITVPTSWDEITLEQFVRLMKLKDNQEEDYTPSLVDVMAVLTNKDKKYIYSLPSDFAETIIAHLLFLNTPLEESPKSEAEINGETYSINYMEKLKFGEYTDANMILNSDPYNYAGLLAILCRKKGEIYNDDYIANTLENRIEMWNKQPITKIYPLVCFFLTLWNVSEGHLQDYLTNAEQQINQLLSNIEDSLNNGACRKYSMKWFKARWKLRKLRKCISQA